MPITVTRTATILSPDQSRVLLRPFSPGDSVRADQIISRVLAMPELQLRPLLDKICSEFCRRHQNILQSFMARFEDLRPQIPNIDSLSETRRLLIGAYFMAEYSLESAALFNPSMVPHPDQSGLSSGSLRFVLSLRATGEGHISSITFRTGVIHADRSPVNRIEINPAGGFVTEPKQKPNAAFEKPLFTRKLAELGEHSDFSRRVMNNLPDPFSVEQLSGSLAAEVLKVHAPQVTIPDVTIRDANIHDLEAEDFQKAAQSILMLARSNYQVHFEPDQELSERVLFPATPSQRNGIEDARFVQFRYEDGREIYYATFTAFDGRVIMPQFVETTDFTNFRFVTLNGPAAENKGMALFPRKIDGRYVMLSRQDNENIYIMFSDNLHFWNDHQMLLKPAFAWELVQLGNCGSPIETDEGWLVLSHGVGPVRQYCIGAFLLDRKDPTQVIGHLPEPLLKPTASEREGYVPNVVYTCGALVHNGELIMPYGLADHSTSFATIKLADILGAMHPGSGAPV